MGSPETSPQKRSDWSCADFSSCWTVGNDLSDLTGDTADSNDGRVGTALIALYSMNDDEAGDGGTKAGDGANRLQVEKKSQH